MCPCQIRQNAFNSATSAIYVNVPTLKQLGLLVYWGHVGYLGHVAREQRPILDALPDI